jgi:hypothetical protein
MARHIFSEIQDLVQKNNKSDELSDEFVICLIWKESNFDDAVQNKQSTATGLMQVTKVAIEDGNRNSPKGVHFEHSEMLDPDKNIDCGTRYLDLRINRAKDKVKGIELYGTGAKYTKSISACEECLKNSSGPSPNQLW